ncbi:hypothetical protein P3H15_33975 [Rhodococcus sp. T2V]|uniref:hypothetical protein n=1 Tax=Rhodococcus sp. T2V TaxID=3034164 RepID=UPI0023E1213E|nr:hypothetical protein [Rhodococcus sp. T2V]MDF3310027.1 hypothetical protein [Rhodococcus sp. T2V]
MTRQGVLTVIKGKVLIAMGVGGTWGARKSAVEGVCARRGAWATADEPPTIVDSDGPAWYRHSPSPR